MRNTETVRTIFCKNPDTYYLQEVDKTHRSNESEPSYEFPGGKIESGQSHIDAILAETEEEVGVNLNEVFTNIQIAGFYAATIERPKINFKTNEATEFKLIVHVYLINVARAFTEQFAVIGLPEDRLTGNTIWVPKKELIELANKKPINSITGSKLREIL
jgi:8-oxo-dGTP pyrophosphatase MutT (NUDIX family)